MARILSLFGFIIAMVWTWNVVHSSSVNVDSESHYLIQDHLTKLIATQVKKKYPTAQNIRVVRLWSEKINDARIRVVFSFRYLDQVNKEGNEGNKPETQVANAQKVTQPELVEQQSDGEGVWVKEPGDGEGSYFWKAVSLRVLSDSIVFSEGLVINPNTPDENSDNNSTEPQSTDEGAPSESKAPHEQSAKPPTN